ncbi:MAG TPA: dihydroxy-acid dehydratase [Planctomycetaceae bacterium]|nr:dihydroxy-acid dehydratase [Planctomycetaceae bacterium]HQZ67000.1 dihydroxy-acid dehydratase [Planctomycetaceae bacterium]
MLNWNSNKLTHGWQKGITAFYYAVGMTADDFNKPQVGIGVPLLEGNTCNIHAYGLAQEIAVGCRNAGMLGFPFGTPGVSDNITQGHEGGNASLPSRNLIANSAECVITSHCYDAMIGLHNCDKNGPGFAMALARTNYPGLIVSGGSILPGCHNGKDITILDVYDSQAAASVGAMTHEESEEIIRNACPGPGGCGIAASFNTWGLAMEAIGLMLPASSSIPAVDPEKKAECRRVGQAVSNLLALNLRPRDILTKAAFRNCAVTIAAAGGSTNGVLHILALAREAGVNFSLRDLQKIFRETPVLCSFAPRGKRTMVDLHKIGGTPILLKHLLDSGLLDGSCMTVTGKTLAENLKDVPQPPAGQDLIVTKENCYKPFADMQVCFGNLAPEGIVFKVSSMKNPVFEGKAVCFDDPRDIVRAVEQRKITPGSVIVLRNMGPVACGMPEVLIATAALAVPELDGKIAFISDARVSGVSHGAIGVHCSPEAIVGGPIGCVEDGDVIAFDLLKGTISVNINDADMATRRAKLQPRPALEPRRGYLADWSATVAQASHGCVSKAMYPECG